MARFTKRYRRRYTKRNADRKIQGGSSTVAAGTQQVVYTWTATDACTVKSIRLDVGVSAAAANIVPYILVSA